MKLFKYTIFLTLPFLLALAACTKEGGVTDVKVGDDWENHAYIVNEETRTDFDSFAGKFTWSEGDVIAVHLTDGTFYETPVDPETKVFTSSTTSTKQRNLYAVYPASVRDNGNYGDPTLNVILPSEYDITGRLSSDYSPVPMIAVNSEEESDLYFRHVGGLLRITCNAVPAETKWISVTFNRPVTGTFTVNNPSSTSPTISNGGSGNTVTFTLSDYSLGEKTSGIILNIPLPTGPYTKVTTAAIDANGSEIYSVERDVNFTVQRFHGRRMAYSLTEVLTDSMQLIVTPTDSTGWTYTIQFNQNVDFPANLSIDWGDGSFSSVTAGLRVSEELDKISHTYSSSNDYTITIDATREGSGAMIPPYRTLEVDKMLKSVPTPLLPMGIEYTEDLFRNCFFLESICPDLFVKNTQIRSLDHAFCTCIRLKEIPAGLFDCLTDIESFSSVFEMQAWVLYSYGLTPISGILSSGIPAGLFDYNVNASNFSSAFLSCDGITEIPEYLFYHCAKATSFNSTFRCCYGLKDIPEALFVNNPEVTSFEMTFETCSGINCSIPANLFANQTKVTSFSWVFANCVNLQGSIPHDLFATNPDVTNFGGIFCDCYSLTGTIPSDLFDHQSNVTNFTNAFSSCHNLEGSIPGALFSKQTNALSFNSAFSGCSGLSGFIPDELFSQNQKAYDFGWCFEKCSGLKLTPNLFLPRSRFSEMSETVYFNSCFKDFGGDLDDAGQAPDIWNYEYGNGVSYSECFSYANKLSNYGSIPAEWTY